ncbi:MAG TPA: PBSX family phage terminase large subunit [Pyrinomonadaceae bacterium]|nr:PBSX family phage terminase large subunit [Pyrinomonadaceae bacterium]
MEIRTNKVFRVLNKSRARITSLRGGTRSGKTYNVLLFLILVWARLAQGEVCTVARNTLPALRASAMRDFFEILNRLDLYRESSHNKSNNEYQLGSNLFEFIGVDQAERVRGRKRNVLFLNEANENELESFRQLALRTTDKIVLDYNPSDPFSWIYDQVEMRDDSELCVTTYRDNPFLEESLVSEIERLRDVDEDYWKVYGLGEIGSGSTRVFTHWKTVTDAAYPHGKGAAAYGLDFGYNEPTALTETRLYDAELYWREMLYQTKLTTADLIEKLKEIPELATSYIVADSAEPKTIEEIRRAGFKIVGAYKGPGSVKASIDRVKSRPLRIHEGSANLLREAKRYSWKKDKKTGQILDEVIDFDNHAIDGGRYGTEWLSLPREPQITKSFSGVHSG